MNFFFLINFVGTLILYFSIITLGRFQKEHHKAYSNEQLGDRSLQHRLTFYSRDISDIALYILR